MTSHSTLPDRSRLFETMSPDQITARYCYIYAVNVTIDEVRRHAQIEGELTDRLLLTTPETRWNEFSDAYGRLYRDLPWLNKATDPPPDERDFRAWGALVG